jgi:AcrR family transcriptional regulator
MSQADQRKKILEEAIGIVYREGVDRITMRSLARKLGYSPAAIYLHFGSKQELEFEIGFHGFELLWQEMSPQLYRLMFQDMTRLQDGEFANDPRVARVRQGVVSVYRSGLERGLLIPCDPEFETAVGWAALHGFVQLTIHGLLPSPGLQSDPAPVRDALIRQRVRALMA